MAQILIRGLDDRVKAHLRERAKRHGRSLEAEVRHILSQSVEPATMGSLPATASLGALFRRRFSRHGLTHEEAVALEAACDDVRAGSRLRVPDFGT